MSAEHEASDPSGAASYWCELAWLPPGTVRPSVLVRVNGTRIVAVEPDTPHPPPGATRLAGLTIPGLANTHSHAFHRALRGRTQQAGPPGGRGSFWTWRDQMYDARRAPRPRQLRRPCPRRLRRDGPGRHHLCR